jgi:hypothetical protein
MDFATAAQGETAEMNAVQPGKCGISMFLDFL